jgi:prophage regulatory protein
MHKLLRLPQVMDRVGLRTTRIYELMGAGTFPKPIRLGERAVSWLESEISAWIAAQAEKPRAEIRTSSIRRKKAEAVDSSPEAKSGAACREHALEPRK